MGCSGYQRQECTHAHAQHNTQSPSVTGGIYRELKSAKEGSVTACVCTQETQSGAALISCAEDIVCDKTKIQQKFAGREAKRKGKIRAPHTPLILLPSVLK